GNTSRRSTTRTWASYAVRSPTEPRSKAAITPAPAASTKDRSRLRSNGHVRWPSCLTSANRPLPRQPRAHAAPHSLRVRNRDRAPDRGCKSSHRVCAPQTLKKARSYLQKRGFTFRARSSSASASCPFFPWAHLSVAASVTPAPAFLGYPCLVARLFASARTP